jgi:hypothetical protein
MNLHRVWAAHVAHLEKMPLIALSLNNVDKISLGRRGKTRVTHRRILALYGSVNFTGHK